MSENLSTLLLAKFEIDMSEKSGEDIAPQSRQTFTDVLLHGSYRGHKLDLTIQTSIKFCDFAEPYRCSFSSHHSQTWQLY